MLPFTYELDTTLFLIGVVIYAINLLACGVVIYHRHHRALRHLTPTFTVGAHVAACLWWLDLSLGRHLNTLWNHVGSSCWFWSLALRTICFVTFIGLVTLRNFTAYKRWRTGRVGQRSLVSATVLMWLPCLVLLITVALLSRVSHVAGRPNRDCEVPYGFIVALQAYQASLIIAMFIMTFVFVWEVHEDSKTTTRWIHPKMLTSIVELTGFALMVVVHICMYVTHVIPFRDSTEADNFRTTVVAMIIPTLMLWGALGLALFYTTDLEFELPLSPSRRSELFFDPETGTWTQNLARLREWRIAKLEEQHHPTPSARNSVPHPPPILEAAAEKLQQLVIQGKLDPIRHFVMERGIELIDYPCSGGQTALHTAVGHPGIAKDTRLEIVDLLVDLRASLELQDDAGQTPLHIAAELCDTQLLCFMVQSATKSAKYGESSKVKLTSLLNLLSSEGATPLHIAVKHEDTGTIMALLGLGASPFVSKTSPSKPDVPLEEWDEVFEAQLGKFSHSKPSFHLAVELGLHNVVFHMLRVAGSTPGFDQVGPFGMTPLAVACYLGYSSIVATLLEHGANAWNTIPSSCGGRRLTILHCCGIGGDPLVLYYVLRTLAAAPPTFHGTDTDSLYDRGSFSIISESEISATTPRHPPQIGGSVSCEGGGAVPSRASDERAGSLGSVSPSNSLLFRAMYFAERSKGVYRPPRIRRTSFTDVRANLCGIGEDDNVRAAVTVLAVRGDLPATPKLQELLRVLEMPWETPHAVGSLREHTSNALLEHMAMEDDTPADYSEQLQRISDAVVAALAEPQADLLLEVLQQDQYQWTGSRFGSPLTEPKARQLASEIRRRVINPKVELANVRTHEALLRRQCRDLEREGRGDEAEKIIKALETLLQAALHVDEQRRRAEREAAREEGKEEREEGERDEGEAAPSDDGRHAKDSSTSPPMRNTFLPCDKDKDAGEEGQASVSAVGEECGEECGESVSPFSPQPVHQSPPATAFVHSPPAPASVPTRLHKPRTPLPGAGAAGSVEADPCFPEGHTGERDSLMDPMPLNVHRYLNRQDCWKQTALHHAVVRRHAGATYLLVATGASTVIKDRKTRRRADALGKTPVQYAEAAPGESGEVVLSAIQEAQQIRSRSEFTRRPHTAIPMTSSSATSSQTGARASSVTFALV
eukprot:Sspe_Gene.89700::Locus_61403_Transcript_1_1_Confidence_1.000_Length_3728::g.89700::m.89700